MEHAIYVNDPEAASRFLFRQSLPFHCRAQAISDTDSGPTCSEHDDLLVFQTPSSHLDRADNCPQCNRCGHLDVVVKGQQFVAIAIEDGSGVRSRKVLPLQARSWQLLLDRLHELIDEVVVGLARNAFMTPAEVLRIVEPFFVVRADVQDDRQRSFRTNAANARVERELANRDAEPACALITDTQNAFAIGYHDHINILIRTIPQKLWD